jgi:hypothetical protein
MEKAKTLTVQVAMRPNEAYCVILLSLSNSQTILLIKRRVLPFIYLFSFAN